jgi:hypothetical protein
MASGVGAGHRRGVVIVVAALAGGVAVPAGRDRVVVTGACAVAVSVSCRHPA